MEKETQKKYLKKLGNQIKKIRKEIDITQTELASRTGGKGKDQQSIQRLESGKINPSYCYLLEIAKALNMTISKLLDF